MVGETTGTRMNTAITNDMVRAICSPSNESRTIASVTTRGPAAPRPQTKRLASSSGSVPENAVASAPSA